MNILITYKRIIESSKLPGEKGELCWRFKISRKKLAQIEKKFNDINEFVETVNESR